MFIHCITNIIIIWHHGLNWTDSMTSIPLDETAMLHACTLCAPSSPSSDSQAGGHVSVN